MDGDSSGRPDADPAARYKLAGVLVEAVVDAVPVIGKPVDEALTDPEELEAVVMGIGVNADLDPDDIDTERPTTTLRAETGGPVERAEVAARLHERLSARAEQVESAAGFADALDDWRGHAVTLGEDVRATVDGGTVTGRATDVAATGALLVETGNGRREVRTGECEELRRR
ncbi:biotin--[acetyl-CoA-carboxylase] ligase [Halosegnis marinus]|uniref:biotin--[acetyl-CoA-carboxylase] ligase n=1 Tax=Halosegnis marinus TaxID=3034023 RepID=UPI003617E548